MMEIGSSFSQWSFVFSLDVLSIELLTTLFCSADAQHSRVLKILLKLLLCLLMICFQGAFRSQMHLGGLFSFASTQSLLLHFAFSVVLICSSSAASCNSFCNKPVFDTS